MLLKLLRSIPALLLALVLAGAMAGAIAARTVDEVVLEPQLYVQALRETGAFETLADRFVPAAAVARIQDTWPDARAEVLQEAAVWARAIFDARWFEARALQVAGALIAYLAGDTDRVGVTVPIDDRLQAVVGVLRDRIDHSPLVRIAYDRMTGLVAGEISAQQQLPFGSTVQRDTWRRAVRMAAPEPWIARVLAEQTQHVVDYLTGAVPILDVTIPLADRQSSVADAIRLVIERSDLPKYLTRRLVDEHLCDQLTDQVLVPDAGITLTREELLATLDGILASDWVRERRRDVVRAVAEYLSGARPTLALDFSLVGLKQLVTERVTDRVRSKLMEYLDRRKPCTSDQTARILLGTVDPLSCQPRGAPRRAMILLLDGFIRTEVRKALDAQVPDRWVQTEDELRAQVPSESWDLVRTGRRWMMHGVRIDRPTVEQLLGGRAEILGAVLEVTRGGWSVTVADLPLAELGVSWTRIDRELGPYRRAAAQLREGRVALLLLAGGAGLALMLLVWLPLRLRLLWLGAGGALGGLLVLGAALELESALAPMVDQALARASPQIPETISAALARVTPAFLERVTNDVTAAMSRPAWLLVVLSLALILTVAIPLLRKPS